MNAILAVDIGGTKTLFQLSTEQGDVILESEYVSQDFVSFDLALADFLNQEQLTTYSVKRACFAVAGPVTGRDASVTNLPWTLNADQLARDFAIDSVHLCNDFEAVGYGISCLSENEIITLQKGVELEGSPRAVIGAGTGLGQALLLPEGEQWNVVATEGGHTDFAPTNELQISLLQHLRKQFDHVSHERIVSGVGLVSIYDFLCEHCQADDSELRRAMNNDDAAAIISQYALDERNDIASQALDLFVQIYGSQAGNLALTVLPRAGLYIAGGIAAKNMERFKTGQFINSFVSKGKMEELMKTIPVYLICQAKVGLMGARLLAQR